MKPAPPAVMQGYLRSLEADRVSMRGIGPSAMRSNCPGSKPPGQLVVIEASDFDLWCRRAVIAASSSLGEAGDFYLRLAVYEARTGSVHGYRIDRLHAAVRSTGAELPDDRRDRQRLQARICLGDALAAALKLWQAALIVAIRQAPDAPEASNDPV